MSIAGILLALIFGTLPSIAATEPSVQKLTAVDSIVNDAIREGQIPGAVVLIWHNGQVVYRKAIGHRSLEPRREPMTLDTVFDLASLTKVVATTTAVMQLVQRGELRVNEPVSKYLPEFAQNGKEDITIRQLLTHFSGLTEDLDLTQLWQGEATAYRMAFSQTPANPPGSRFLYSDINFIVLGALIEKVSGMPLDEYTSKHVFGPLGMTHTRYLPPKTWLPKIAPTQYDEQNHMLRGMVHDPTARRMGGVAGHAGIFSTADDLSKFAQALLNGSSILSPAMVEKMTTPQQPPNAQTLRGFGWDIDSPFSSNRGDLLPVGSFGHTGFTGTSLWIDPTTRTYIILLTNAVHPRGGSAVALRSKVATAVAAALSLSPDVRHELAAKNITGYNESQTAARRVGSRNGAVKTGIDVLEANNFDILRGTSGPRKIGLLTNQTGLDAEGVRTIDVLAHAPGVSLDVIFSPEHGVTGALDTIHVGNSKDAATGVPVVSLYGPKDSMRRPSLEALKKLDTVLVDIQDAGVRFYTYETTVGYFLEAAAQAGTEVIVLDRPNPITGSFVQGPIADVGRENFTSYSAVPVRHGMTLGELARMYNAERNIHARLQVVPMDGWMRGDWFDATGLSWVNPSPNLRSVTEAALYPGVGLVEGANVSVGRGTDTPFELLGAPWIKGRELANYLNARNIPGVRFVATTFTPTENRHAGQLCGGVNFVLLERNALDAPELGVELAVALHKLYPNQFQTEKLIDLVMNQATVDAIQQGEDPRRISEDWRDSLEKFQSVRAKYLLYK